MPMYATLQKHKIIALPYNIQKDTRYVQVRRHLNFSLTKNYMHGYPNLQSITLIHVVKRLILGVRNGEWGMEIESTPSPQSQEMTV